MYLLPHLIEKVEVWVILNGAFSNKVGGICGCSNSQYGETLGQNEKINKGQEKNGSGKIHYILLEIKSENQVSLSKSKN